MVDDASGLPDLNSEQMTFVAALLQGKSASDAYRAAYGNSIKPESIWAAASRLRSDVRVQSWLAASRKAGLGSTKVTLDGHVSELERLREIALETGNIGAAVQAEQLRGKASGHYTERLDITTSDPEQTLKEIASIVGEDTANQLAAQFGLKPTQH